MKYLILPVILFICVACENRPQSPIENAILKKSKQNASKTDSLIITRSVHNYLINK